jgi:hypothetical protein
MTTTGILSCAAELHAMIINYTKNPTEQGAIMQIVGTLLMNSASVEDDDKF